MLGDMVVKAPVETLPIAVRVEPLSMFRLFVIESVVLEFAVFTEIRPPPSLAEIAFPYTNPWVVTLMAAPALRLALPWISVVTVDETLTKAWAMPTLIRPPPPPVAVADTIPSPAEAAKPTPPMPCSC